MKRILLLLCLLLTTATVTAQFGNRRGQRPGSIRNQQPQVPPNENQIAEMERKNAEKRAKYITRFISTLEADDFQKEIAKQTIDEYFELTQKFLKVPFESSVERKDAFDGFKKQHFAELRTLLSEDDGLKLDDFLDGKFEKNSKKKKKKKKRRKNKSSEDDN